MHVYVIDLSLRPPPGISPAGFLRRPKDIPKAQQCLNPHSQGVPEYVYTIYSSAVVLYRVQK